MLQRPVTSREPATLRTRERCEAGRHAAATTPQSRPANDRPPDPVVGPGCARYRAAVYGCRQRRLRNPEPHRGAHPQGPAQTVVAPRRLFTPGDNALVHIVGRGLFLTQSVRGSPPVTIACPKPGGASLARHNAKGCRDERRRRQSQRGRRSTRVRTVTPASGQHWPTSAPGAPHTVPSAPQAQTITGQRKHAHDNHHAPTHAHPYHRTVIPGAVSGCRPTRPPPRLAPRRPPPRRPHLRHPP